MRNIIWCIVVSVFIFGISFRFLQQNSAFSQQAIKPDSLAKLKSSEIKIRKEGVVELLNSRKSLTAALLAFAAQKEGKVVFSGTKEMAIETLGKFRAIEAVSFLIQHVTYKVPYVSREDNPIQGFPCARALTVIGAPAFSEIWYRFRSPMDNLEVMLFAYVIRHSDGEEIGQARIELARKQAENIGTVDGIVARKNLDRLLEHYKTKKTGF